MKKLPLIIAHEYKAIASKKSFIIMTLLIPVLMIVIGAIPVLFAYLNNSTDTHVERIAVIDQSEQQYGKALVDKDNYSFVVFNAEKSAPNPRELYTKSTNLNAVIVIPGDIIESKQVKIYSEENLSHATMGYINDCLNDTLTAAKIQSYGIENLQTILDECDINVDVNNIKWDKNGNEQQTSTTIASIIGVALSLLTYTFVLMYGAMIMNSVVEEKTNRIVEVIVSSCKPVELMLGKIIGVGLVGLTQFAIWAALLSAITMVLGVTVAGGMAAANPEAIQSGLQMASSAHAQMPAETSNVMADVLSSLAGINYFSIFIHFICYFIGGYLLYASLFAGLGSAVDQASDTSQFTMPVILLMVIALYVGIACIDNPNGSMAVWCSIIPFTSPVVMMIRLPFDVPVWQQLLSITLLFATAFAVIWLAARIYRTGILMYGKKRSYRDLFRWTMTSN